MFQFSRIIRHKGGSAGLRLALLVFISAGLTWAVTRFDSLILRIAALGGVLVGAGVIFGVYRLISNRSTRRTSVPLLSDEDVATKLTRKRDMGEPFQLAPADETGDEAHMKISPRNTYEGLVCQVENNQDISALAHDLKTPLNAIIGFAGLMESEIKGPLPEGYKDYPPLIREGGETLLNMVEQLLEAARSGRTEWIAECALIDLRSCLLLAQARFTDAARQAGIELILLGDDTAVTAYADRQLVARMLDNVISNALKYSPRDSKVFLLAQSQPDGAYLGVRDLGIGMSETDLERIGGRFVQGDNANGRKGTGLGLSIVKRLTQLQSGSLRIRSAPQQGTEIEIILPNAPT